MMLHTKYQGSRPSDFRQEAVPPLLGLGISDKKDKSRNFVHLRNYSA